jgi:hypothetical protein
MIFDLFILFQGEYDDYLFTLLRDENLDKDSIDSQFEATYDERTYQNNRIKDLDDEINSLEDIINSLNQTTLDLEAKIQKELDFNTETTLEESKAQSIFFLFG